MGTYEETPRLRTVRLGMVGCFCIAPLLFLHHRPLGGLAVLLAGAVIYARLGHRAEGHESERDGSRGARLLRSLLGLTAIGLALLAGFFAAIPHFPGGARPWSNDAAAIATCKNLAAAQARFRERRVLDSDGDGRGEFGSFLDLARADPPELPASFKKLVPMPDGSPAVRRSGFLFQVHVIEPESAWCCYAWPVSFHGSGKRCYFVDQSGVVRSSQARRRYYSGTDSVPRFDSVWTDRNHWREVR